MADLPIQQVFPGHGKPFSNHRRLIQRQQERIEQRKQQCLALVADGASTVGEITAIMYSRFPPNARFSGISMVVGYLDLLLDEGLLIRKVVNGVWQFEV